jgi:acyl-CoA thioester hydrolase
MSRLDTSMPVNAKRAATVNESRIRVRYAETDQMGVVYHANHFIWFEVGRVELLRQFGFSYKNMEQEDGCFIAVVDAHCRYKAPVHYDDEVIVRTYLKHVREKVIRFGYELRRRKRASCWPKARPRTSSPMRMKPRALPEKYMKVFRAAVGR